MRNRAMILVGSLLILLGLLSAISAIFDINLWMVCWPTLLILIGVLLLVGPRIGFPVEGVKILPISSIRRSESWQVGDEDIWTFVGDIRLDFSQAEIPSGVSTIRVVGFVGDIDFRIPEGVEYSISSTAFLTDFKLMGVKKQTFFGVFREKSAGYDIATHKI